MKINNAVSRAMDVLTYLSQQDKAITLTEISRELKIPKSSTLDILYTLVEKGFIEIENPDFKTYRLGIGLFTLGASSLNRNNLKQVAHKTLVSLSEATKKTIFMAIPRREQIVYISKFEGASPLQSICSIGSTNPMYLTGLGKAILANMSNQDILSLYGEGPYEMRTAQTINTYEQLIEDLENTRVRGYAIDDQEGVEFIYCYAAPIYDYSNAVVGAISVVSPVNEIGVEEKRSYPSLIVEAAMEISKKLGYTGTTCYEIK